MTQEPTVSAVLEYAAPHVDPLTMAFTPIRVLLVEDEPEAADLVQFSLEETTGGFDVQWAENLAEATIRLSQPGIDVVLLDLGLPELDGYRSYRVIEVASGRKVPVVILTADERSISRDLTLGLGASDYLLKHEVTPARLKDVVRNAAQQGRPR